MSEWPKLGELKQVLDADPEGTQWDGAADGTRLTRLLASAIDVTTAAVGGWDGDPTPGLAQAALRAAQLLAPPINRAPDDIASDPIFAALLVGHRKRFGIS